MPPGGLVMTIEEGFDIASWFFRDQLEAVSITVVGYRGFAYASFHASNRQRNSRFLKQSDQQQDGE